MDVSTFLEEVGRWAEEEPNIRGIALVGSHATGTNQIDSDVDLILVCNNPELLIRDKDWITRFGRVRDVLTENYGALTSLRTFYQDGLEVEFGITNPNWAKVPLDPGTRQVILGGIQILYDPDTLLREAINATA